MTISQSVNKVVILQSVRLIGIDEIRRNIDHNVWNKLSKFQQITFSTFLMNIRQRNDFTFEVKHLVNVIFLVLN